MIRKIRRAINKSNASRKEHKKLWESDHIVDRYERYGNELQKPEIKLFEKYKMYIDGRSILDIGVGGGRTTSFLSKHSRTYFGIDYSDKMIKVCIKKFANLSHLKFSTVDVRDLSPLKAAKFDFILFSFNGLDNINHEERIQVINSIGQHLSPDSLFMFSTHNLLSIPDRFRIVYNSGIHRLGQSIYQKWLFGKLNKHYSLKIPYLEIYDGALDFELKQYYIKPKEQLVQLEENGFNVLDMVDIEGNFLEEHQLHQVVSPWIYFVCKKNF